MEKTIQSCDRVSQLMAERERLFGALASRMRRNTRPWLKADSHMSYCFE